MITLKDFLSLIKFKLSVTVTLSMIFTFIIAKQSIDMSLLLPFIGVLLLAFGVSGLNQCQEYKEDALMTRTKNRPIASKRVSLNQGLLISFGLIALAFGFIWYSLEFLGILIFSSVILIYNLFYTKSKKTTIYSAVYGAILGVIPPMIGWIVAQESLFDIRFIAIALFYFIWQIPHFWLLILKYHKQYEKAGFPTVAHRFGVEALERITFIWLMLTLISGIFIVLAFEIKAWPILILLGGLHLYLVFANIKLLTKRNYLFNFISINLYMVLLMLLIVIHAVL